MWAQSHGSPASGARSGRLRRRRPGARLQILQVLPRQAVQEQEINALAAQTARQQPPRVPPPNVHAPHARRLLPRPRKARQMTRAGMHRQLARAGAGQGVLQQGGKPPANTAQAAEQPPAAAAAAHRPTGRPRAFGSTRIASM